MKNEVQKSSGSLSVMLKSEMPQLNRLASKYMSVEKLIGVALETVRRPELARCTPASVVQFCKKCAEWGTDRIGPGGVWPVAYGDQLTPIPDWRFLVQKAKDAKAIKHITCEEVFAGDVFEYSRGMNPDITHRPQLSNRGAFVACYCIYTLPDGTRDFAVMTAEEIEHVRNLAPSKNSPAWKNYTGEMRKKTCIRRTLKMFEGASVELSKMLEADAEAMGYIDIDAESIVREPVTMPVITEQSSSAPNPDLQWEPEPPREHNHEREPDHDNNDGGDLYVVGMVEKVSEKHGKSAKGEWTKYGICIKGEWYGTFSETVAGVAQVANSQGSTVKLCYADDGKFKNALTCEIVVDDIDDVPM